jgi:hypothetical protein
LDIDDTTFKGQVTLSGGPGRDLINIDKLNTAAKTAFRRGLKATLRTGDDTIDVGRDHDALNGGVFSSSFFVDGGSGNNVLIAHGQNRLGNRFTVGPTRINVALQ